MRNGSTLVIETLLACGVLALVAGDRKSVV